MTGSTFNATIACARERVTSKVRTADTIVATSLSGAEVDRSGARRPGKVGIASAGSCSCGVGEAGAAVQAWIGQADGDEGLASGASEAVGECAGLAWVDEALVDPGGAGGAVEEGGACACEHVDAVDAGAAI